MDYKKSDNGYYQGSCPASRSSGACALLLCDSDRNLNCAVCIVGNVADDDANTYIYYTFIILHYNTVHISLFSCISILTLSVRAVSSLFSLPHFRGLRSVPLQPISSGYDRKPRPAFGTRSRRAPVPF